MKDIKEKYKLPHLIKCDLILFLPNKKINYDYYGDYYKFYFGSILDKLDGPARIWFNNNKIVYKEFYLNNFIVLDYKIFAEKTNHLICLNCNDFCKQECF